MHTLRHTFATHLWRAGRTCASSRFCSATPASQARRATPGRHQNDQQHAEPARSAPLERRATRLSGCHGSGSGGGGYPPPPWRSVLTGAFRSSRGRRATGHGRHHGVPDGGPRRPCRAMRRLRCNPHRLQLVPQPSLSQMPGTGAGPMARGSASRTAAGAVLSCRLHSAGTVGEIAFQNKSVVYAILFRRAAETLATIAANPRHLGAKLGMTMVLHTWGQTLSIIPRPLRRSQRRALT